MADTPNPYNQAGIVIANTGDKKKKKEIAAAFGGDPKPTPEEKLKSLKKKVGG